MSATPPVLLDITGRIARITFNRPDKGNAFDIASARAFKAAVAGVAQEANVRSRPDRRRQAFLRGRRHRWLRCRPGSFA